MNNILAQFTSDLLTGLSNLSYMQIVNKGNSYLNTKNSITNIL